jgi:hypothetical protein
MSELFLREFDFPVDFSGDTALLRYEVCEPRAVAGHVSVRRGYNELGALCKEHLVVAVRDKGSPTRPTMTKAVVVVRKLNDLIPLPEGCGNLVPPGFLQSSGGRFQYYVFLCPDADRAIDNSSGGTTLPPPERASSTPSAEASETGCPCVVLGPSVHESEEAQTTSEAEPPDDWEFPDVAPASGASR